MELGRTEPYLANPISRRGNHLILYRVLLREKLILGHKQNGRTIKKQLRMHGSLHAGWNAIAYRYKYIIEIAHLECQHFLAFEEAVFINIESKVK